MSQRRADPPDAVQRREPIELPKDLHSFNVLPGMARKNYNVVMAD